MVNFAIVIIVVIAILVILIVLAQNPKGSGVSAAFGGAGTTQLMGAKRTTDVLEKITWGLGIGIFVLSLIVNVSLSSDETDGAYVSPVSKDIQQNSTPQTPAPAPAPTPTPTPESTTPTPTPAPTPKNPE